MYVVPSAALLVIMTKRRFMSLGEQHDMEFGRSRHNPEVIVKIQRARKEQTRKSVSEKPLKENKYQGKSQFYSFSS